MAAPLPPPGRDPRDVRPAVPQPVPVPAALPAGQAAQPASPAPPAQPAQPAVPVVVPKRRAPRRELTTQQREVTAADEAGFATLEAELGGRKPLVSVLAAADLNQDEVKILGLLADPANDTISLAKLCLGNGLKIARLMKMFQAAALVKGQTKAIARIAEKLPDVAAGVMEDAVAGDKPCSVCNGYCFLSAPTKDDPNATEKCAACFGKGTVYHSPDHHVREIALRIGGLLDKGGSGAKILIANQNNGGGAADSKSFDSLMTGLDAVLYGEGRSRQQPPAVDGEVIE